MLFSLKTFDYLAQVAIVLLGGSAIWLVGSAHEWSRWGYILGLCGQPFWIYAAVRKKQWGVFLVSCWYTYSWYLGIQNYWLR